MTSRHDLADASRRPLVGPARRARSCSWVGSRTANTGNIKCFKCTTVKLCKCACGGGFVILALCKPLPLPPRALPAPCSSASHFGSTMSSHCIGDGNVEIGSLTRSMNKTPFQVPINLIHRVWRGPAALSSILRTCRSGKRRGFPSSAEHPPSFPSLFLPSCVAHLSSPSLCLPVSFSRSLSWPSLRKIARHKSKCSLRHEMQPSLRFRVMASYHQLPGPGPYSPATGCPLLKHDGQPGAVRSAAVTYLSGCYRPVCRPVQLTAVDRPPMRKSS